MIDPRKLAEGIISKAAALDLLAGGQSRDVVLARAYLEAVRERDAALARLALCEESYRDESADLRAAPTPPLTLTREALRAMRRRGG